jgi:hypothetical protein
MAARSDSPGLLQSARCEDLLLNQIREVSVVGLCLLKTWSTRINW